MNREQLAHVSRAAATIAEDPETLVLGSQAILGDRDADELPDDATRSIEADIAFWNDADERKSDDVDGAIGELSMFHQTFGYYAQGVSVTTAHLPAGWEARCIPFDPTDPDNKAVCIEKHDLVVAKLVAGREKDHDFTTALIGAKLVDVATLLERAGNLDELPPVITRVRDAISRYAAVHEAYTERPEST